MGEKCKPSYRNLNTIQSYSEQKYATVQWCQQNCENDEWLKREIEKLKYLAPPNVRNKFFIGKNVNAEKSWGYEVPNDSKVQFSSKTFESIFIDFRNDTGDKWIDWNKSNVIREQPKDSSGNVQANSRIHLPNHIEDRSVPPEYSYFGTGWDSKNKTIVSGYNSAWYVGFDKSKNFYLKPGWINNWKDPAIPAISRAQTFKAEATGKLESVDLALEYNGGPTTHSSPLIVQIWPTYQGTVLKSTWNNKTKKVVYNYIKRTSSTPASLKRFKLVKKVVKNKKGEIQYLDKKKTKKKYKEYYKADKNGDWVREWTTVAKPNSKAGKSLSQPLAQYEYNPQSTNKGGWQTMSFKNPCTVQKGTSYAIVLHSPLNSWDNCPRWGGWGRNCKKDKLYENGDAFISKNNGRSWNRYGKKGVDEGIKEYKQGKYVPQDYKFVCKVETKAGKPNFVPVYEEGEHYLYLKPIYNNPIHTVQIIPEGEGTEGSQSDVVQCDYQLSVDGDTWMDFPDNYTIQLSEPKRVIFLRAKMSRSEGHDSETPYIEHLTVNLHTNLPEEMYVRTVPYDAPLGHILGASLWGKVYAPYSTEPSVECTVDIVEERECEESFDIVELDYLDEKMTEKGLDITWMENCPTINDRCLYLTNNPQLLETLKYHEIYVKPHEIEDMMYNLSFAPSDDELVVAPIRVDEATDEDTGTVTSVNIYPDNIGGIPIVDEVAYPVISCQLEPEDGSGHGNLQTYGEWYDYWFDYDTNSLIFYRDSIDDMVTGNLIVKYNPVFIKDLTNDEVGRHYDENGIISDGIELDYFKESFVIDNTNLESRRVKLRVQPVDPIKYVYLYRADADDGDEPTELLEDVDFTVDTYSHELVFEVNNLDGVSTILNLGDTLEVIYTPNLASDSISIGYHAKRTNVSKQCSLENYYIEYKV